MDLAVVVSHSEQNHRMQAIRGPQRIVKSTYSPAAIVMTDVMLPWTQNEEHPTLASRV